MSKRDVTAIIVLIGLIGVMLIFTSALGYWG
jgi:hypothetical protein